MNGPVEKRLVSFVHYSDSVDQMLDDDIVLIRIGNLYVQYNRAKSYNINTDMPNKVTITHAIADDDVSERLTALSVGETFEYLYTASTTNANQNRLLMIQVCSAVLYETSQMDYAIVRIYFNDDRNFHNLSDCKKEFIFSTKAAAPSFIPTLFESPTSSPAATFETEGTIQKNDPIIEHDDNNASSGNTTTIDDNDGRFEGMIYIVIASAVGVLLFAGTGYYYIAHHLKEQEMILATQSASNSKYPQTMEKKDGAPSSVSHCRTNQPKRRTADVEDLSDTAEEEYDDDDEIDDDALYVMYDAHMLEI